MQVSTCTHRLCAAVSLIALAALSIRAAERGAEEVFSGPQVGEKLPELTVVGVFDELAGKKLNPVKEAGDKPICLVFIHEATRPSVGLARTLGDYAAKLGKDKLALHIIFLTSDATETENFLKRARHALAKDAPLAISPDGIEGPGAYGLNRKMMVTALVAKGGKVTANFALVQPSLNVDAPQIAQALHAALGEDKTPTHKELGIGGDMPARGDKPTQVDLRPLLAPVIKLTASDEEVMAAAEKVEAAAAKDPAVKQAVGDVARRIVDAKKLDSYGTKKAQDYLARWAKEFVAEPRK